jgi:hypothetical protein
MWQISIVLTSLAGLCVVLAVDLWQTARKAQRLRSELDAAHKDRDEWAAIAALDHETAVRLACQLHGKAAVAKAMDDARKRGNN